MLCQQHVWDAISDLVDVSTVGTDHLTLLHMSLIITILALKNCKTPFYANLPPTRHCAPALRSLRFLLRFQAFGQGGY